MAHKVFTDDIRDNGTVAARYVETYSKLIDYVIRHPEDPETICFVMDDGGVDAEIRIHITDLRRIVEGDLSDLSQVSDADEEFIKQMRAEKNQ